MTCERYERDLALAVEGDLPERARMRLEPHLRRCARCQEFLRGLEESQRRLKGLAAEAVDDAALAAVRTRVAAAIREPARPPALVPAWGWALAASLAVVALALAIVLGRTTPTAPRLAGGAVRTPPAASASLPAPAPVEPVLTPPRSDSGRATSRGHSTPPLARTVSRSVEPKTARVVPELSPEDADQLARAVVVVSRIRRLREGPSTAPAEPLPAAVVRLETPDPGVVIYWQLDSNGG